MFQQNQRTVFDRQVGREGGRDGSHCHSLRLRLFSLGVSQLGNVKGFHPHSPIRESWGIFASILVSKMGQLPKGFFFPKK